MYIISSLLLSLSSFLPQAFVAVPFLLAIPIVKKKVTSFQNLF